MWSEFLRDESAPTMVEYGLLLVFIVLVAILAVAVFGDGVSSLFMVPPQYFQ